VLLGFEAISHNLRTERTVTHLQSNQFIFAWRLPNYDYDSSSIGYPFHSGGVSLWSPIQDSIIAIQILRPATTTLSLTASVSSPLQIVVGLGL